MSKQRKFKLLKEMPDIMKGAILEEHLCDYHCRDRAFWKVTNYSPRYTPHIVEHCPEWFEEVAEEPKPERVLVSTMIEKAKHTGVYQVNTKGKPTEEQRKLVEAALNGELYTAEDMEDFGEFIITDGPTASFEAWKERDRKEKEGAHA